MLIDTHAIYGQTTWLTVKGPPNATKDNQSGGIVGRTTFAGKMFSLLATMGLGVNDLLHIGRPVGQAEDLTVGLWQSGGMFDTLLLSGPRAYVQPGQESEVPHQLYINWAGKGKRLDSNLLDIGLDRPWSAHMSRAARGAMIGQVVTTKGLQTHLTVIDYGLVNGPTHDSPGKLCLKVENMAFAGKELPHRMNDSVMWLAKETFALFQEHCAPSDMGKKQPYWMSLRKDAVAAWQSSADQHKTWYEASAKIQTPWDFLAYCQVYGGPSGAAKGDPEKLHTKMLWRLRKHVPAERIEELQALLQFAKQVA